MRLQLQKFNVAVQAKKQQRHLQATYYACDKKEKKNTRRKWKKYKSDGKRKQKKTKVKSHKNFTIFVFIL